MDSDEPADGQIWSLLIYRLPTQPSSARVAIWRDLRRLGALPLQQSCIVMPERPSIVDRLNEIVDRIKGLGGTSHLFRLTDLSSQQAADLRAAWSSLRAHEYAEIIEECETKFLKEVDFEIFRDNLTSGEAEELEADLDKIRAWYQRVRSRDWFGAEHRLEVEAAIAKCETRLEEFTTLVFERESTEGPSLERPVEMEWGDTSEGHVVPLTRGRGRRRAKRPI
jgi:ChrB-like protein